MVSNQEDIHHSIQMCDLRIWMLQKNILLLVMKLLWKEILLAISQKMQLMGGVAVRIIHYITKELHGEFKLLFWVLSSQHYVFLAQLRDYFCPIFKTPSPTTPVHSKAYLCWRLTSLNNISDIENVYYTC